MKQFCVACGSSVGFSKTKIGEGFLCSDCAGLLPPELDEAVEKMSAENAKAAVAYAKQRSPLYAGAFADTASYGSVAVDVLHGAMRIGEEKPFLYVGAQDLASVGLTMRPVKRNGSSVTAEVLLSFSLRNGAEFPCAFVFQDSCALEPIGGGQYKYGLPCGAQFLADAIHRMIEGEKERAEKKAPGAIPLGSERAYAMGVLMLDEGFSEEDLRARKRLFSKIFHPDAKTGSEELMKKVNDACAVLESKAV